MNLMLVALACVVMAATTHAASSIAYFPPFNNAAHCEDPSIQNKTLYYDMLESSTQMPAQVGAMRVGVPFHDLVKFFNQPEHWPIWNHLFKTNFVTKYGLCANFNNVSYTNPPPVSPPFPANLTAPHYIDQHGWSDNNDTFVFGWIFQLRVGSDMIVFGRHTFTLRKYVDQSGLDSSTAESFEKAAGSQLNTHVNRVAWTIALQESLLDGIKGFMCLERTFTKYRRLDLSLVRKECLNFKP